MNTELVYPELAPDTTAEPRRHSHAAGRMLMRKCRLAGFCLLFSPALLFASSRQSAGVSNAVVQTGGQLLAAPTNHLTGMTNLNTLLGTNSMETLNDKYRLAIGDHLSFQIVQDQDAPQELFVTDSGDIQVPYLGRVPAVGKTCKQLAWEIKAALDKDYYYNATVIIAVDVKTKDRGTVYLVGSVRVPGPEEIPSNEILTVSKAIMRAGGFTDFADEKHVRITRKGSGTNAEDQTFTVNVQEILQHGKTMSDLKLEPGDVIYIPDRTFRF